MLFCRLIYLRVESLLGVCWLSESSSLSWDLVEQPVVLLLEVLMIPSMERKLASLSKCLLASIYPAYERFLMCVGVLMFSEILW
jgi:hypothetical protein